MIKDKISLYNQYAILKTPCLSCQKKNHRINQCPYLNIKARFNPRFIIQKSIFSKPQIRTSFNRNLPKTNGIRTPSALLNRKKIMKKAISVRFNKDLMRNYEETMKNSELENKECRSDTNLDDDMRDNEISNQKFRNYSQGSMPSLPVFSEGAKRYKSLDLLPFPIEPYKLKKDTFSFEKEQSFEGENSKKHQNNANEVPQSYFDIQDLDNIDNKKKFMDYCNEDLSPKNNNENRNFIDFTVEAMNPRKIPMIHPLKLQERQSSPESSGEIKEKSMGKEISPLLQMSKIRSKTHFHKTNTGLWNMMKLATRLESRDLFWYDFERNKEWNVYFKSNNSEYMIKEFERKRLTKFKKL